MAKMMETAAAAPAAPAVMTFRIMEEVSNLAAIVVGVSFSLTKKRQGKTKQQMAGSAVTNLVKIGKDPCDFRHRLARCTTV